VSTPDSPQQPIDNRVLELLRALVQIPTESGAPNQQLIAFSADHLHGCGAWVRQIPGPEGRSNLIASIGPQVAGGLLLSGHTDVVPAGEGWATPPYAMSQIGTRLAGRGTADMKGFIACALAIAEGLDSADLLRPVHMALSYDEEVGCLGVRGLLDQLASAPALAHVQPDVVLIGEPTMMRPRHSHLGKVAYKVQVQAHAGHSSLSPFLPSAIRSSVRLIHALESVAELHQALATRDDAGEANAAVTVNVGTIRGGTALNVLAEHCEFNFELRHSAAFNPDELLEAFWTVVEAERLTLAEVDGNVFTEELSRYPALATDQSNRWLRLVERVADRGPSTPVSFGTEGGLFARVLPQAAVVICGPGDIGVAHQPNEYIEREQLESCVRFLPRLINRVCRESLDPS
jgi:acetylornithine deacetylase